MNHAAMDGVAKAVARVVMVSAEAKAVAKDAAATRVLAMVSAVLMVNAAPMDAALVGHANAVKAIRVLPPAW